MPARAALPFPFIIRISVCRDIGVHGLVILRTSVAVLDDLDLLALEDLYGFLVVAFKLDLDLCREWLGLYDYTLTVSSLYDGAYRGGVSDSLLIGLVLVSETAQESAARTGYLGGVE